MKKIPTLKNAILKGKKVLLRVDFNVPFDPKTKKISDDSRIRLTLPTIRTLIKKGAKTIIVTHLGRPEGKRDPQSTTDKIADHLQKLLKKKIYRVDQAIGPIVKKKISGLKNGDLLMLENIRFYPGEINRDKAFTKELASLADCFVLDAFGVCHRDQPSVSGIPKLIPSYMGLLMEEEVRVLSKILHKPQSPLTLIIGGAKIDTKIDLLKKFIGKADYIVLGGALANTFLSAAGYFIGESLYEKDKIDVAREIMLMAEKAKTHFILPKDVVAATEINDKAETLILPINDIEGDMRILDIGLMSRTRIYEIIKKSRTVIWNGPLGLFEYKPFQGGTRLVADSLSKCPKTVTIIGGGDTLEAIRKFKIPFSRFSHVSTGGGAMLEFLGGKKMPGIEALKMSQK